MTLGWNRDFLHRNRDHPPYEHLQLRPLTRGASPRPRSAPPGPPRKARPPALRRASCAAPLGPAVSPSATLQRGWPRFAWRAGLRPPSGYRVLGHPAVPVRGRATPDGSPQAFAPGGLRCSGWTPSPRLRRPPCGARLSIEVNIHLASVHLLRRSSIISYDCCTWYAHTGLGVLIGQVVHELGCGCEIFRRHLTKSNISFPR